MPNQQSFEFVKVMTKYGISLGYMIGCVGAIPLALVGFDVSLLLPLMALVVIIMMSGGLLGMVYGAVSGFFSGLLMTTTTRYIFPDIRQDQVYKITMGLLAFGTTLTMFVIDYVCIGTHNGELFARTMPASDWYAIGLMSLIFAVYASQRTATQYLLETKLQ